LVQRLPERPYRPPLAERERFYDESALTAAPFFRGLLVAALAVSVALFIAALSCRQVSQRDSAMPVLTASVEALTDPQRLIESHQVALRTTAEGGATEGIAVPGFPVAVTLTAEEVRTMQPPALADILSERAAAVVYEDGMEALDQTGRQDDSLFSAQGVVRRVSDRLTADAHNSATRWTVVLLLVTAGLAVTVVLVYREERRLRALGFGVLLGGLAGLVLSLLAGLLANQAGSDDPFVEDVREIVTTVLEVPRRNYLVVSLLGVGIMAVSMVLQFLRRRGQETGDYFEEFEDA
jgi:hypothetical protein